MVERTLPHEVVVSAALRRRSFSVERVWVAGSTHVAYLVDPDPTLDWEFPEMEGADDVGNVYLSRGGAMSPARDGRHDGELSVDAPAAEARRLTLRIAWDEGESGQTASVVVDLASP